MNFLLVFLGSGLGGALRWLIGLWLNGRLPLGTLCVNIAGCFLLAAITRLCPDDAHLKLLLGTGLCGGFTTFSTFINENLFLLRGGQLLGALSYLLLSILLGLLAAWLGWHIK